jgi:hypothetical protein
MRGPSLIFVNVHLKGQWNRHLLRQYRLASCSPPAAAY